jgi:hypothetical protein
LEGIPLNDNDLRRATASEAKAIFIMTNKFSSNPDEEDAKTILQMFSIQRHLKLNKTKSSPGGVLYKACSPLKYILPDSMLQALQVLMSIELNETSERDFKNIEIITGKLFCLQLIRPENQRHLVKPKSYHSQPSSLFHNNLIICINEIKMGVIAKSCIFPVSVIVNATFCNFVAHNCPLAGNWYFDHELATFFCR